MSIHGFLQGAVRRRVASIVAATTFATLGLAGPALVGAGSLASAADGVSSITSDLADYRPGATVSLTGRDWTPSLAVHIRVDDTAGQTWKLDSSPDPVAASDGTLAYQFTLPTSFIATYSVLATQAQGDGTTVSATTTFTDQGPANNIDQFANDAPTGYQNGNLNGNQATYKEGDSVPYRSRLTELTPGATYRVTIEYDTTQNGLHAEDYLTTWSRTVPSANPCELVSPGNQDPCGGATIPATLPIPADSNVTSAGITQIPGVFSLYGGTFVTAGASIPNTNGNLCGKNVASCTITANPSAYRLSGTYADSSQTALDVFVTASQSSMVLAWGGHISTRTDWGLDKSAINISGSPYHMRLIDLTCSEVDNCSQGNQDRSLSADAVIFPGSITVIKQATPEGSTQFPFTASPAPLENFSLVDDGTSANTKVFGGLLGVGTSFVIAETPVTNWALDSYTCVVDLANGGTFTKSSTSTSTIKLGEGENWTCTYNNHLQTIQAQPLTVSVNAAPTFTRKYAWNITKLVDKTKVTIAEGGNATFNYTVNATHDSGTDSAWANTGTATLTNPNPVAVTVNTVAITSPFLGGTCAVTAAGPYTVPANGTLGVAYSCTYASVPTPSSGTLTATASWSSPQGLYVWASTSNTGSTGVSFSTPTTIVDGTVTVVDNKTTAANVTLGTASYTQANPIPFTYSVTKSGVAGTCTAYNNTAAFTTNTTAATGSASQSVTVCVAKDLTVSKTANGSFGRKYTWSIDKSVDQTRIDIANGGKATFNFTVAVSHDAGTDTGYRVTGKITVTNPNDFEDISLTNVTDTINNGGVCSFTSGSTTANVPKSGTTTLDYECTYASTPSPLAGTNTATATWDAAAATTPTGSASGTAGVDFATVSPSITDGSVTVTDTRKGTLGTASYTDASPKNFTYAWDSTGTPGACTNYDNTATFTTNTTATTGNDSQRVTVCVGLDLTVTKTATPTYTRTYHWTIDKSVGQTKLNVAAGTDGTFNYTVAVSHDAGVDSAWMVSGSITVTNPNSWQAITADVTDAITGGGTCAVVGGTSVVVPASNHVTLAYTCSYASAPTSASVTNTATATWVAATYHTPSGSASGSETAVFGAPTTIVDGSVNVTDDKTNPASPVSLGSASYTQANPITFTYSVTKSGVAGKCTDYTNTATFTTNTTGTTDSDVQKVTLCSALDVTVSKTATPTFTRTFEWKILKLVDKSSANVPDGTDASFHYTVRVTHDSGTDSAWVVTGDITVANPNDWEDITVDLTDSVNTMAVAGGTCVVTNGAAVMVPKSGTASRGYTCTWTKAPTAASGTNTATATWSAATYATPTGTASGTAGYAFTTPSTIVDGSVVVTDTRGGALGTVHSTDASPTEFGYDLPFSGVGGTCTTYDNTASFVASTSGTTGSSSKSVQVCVGKDLTITKSATPTVTRTVTWSIDKDVDATKIAIANGNLATFNYTVTVTHSAADSGWQVTGSITVSNPNDWEAISGNVTDAVNNMVLLGGGSCVVDNAGAVTVPKSGTATVGYTCTYDKAPTTLIGINTATVTWNKATYATPTGSATYDIGFVFADGSAGNPSVVNPSVTVVDDKTDPANPVTLGTVDYTDPSPSTFQYSVSKSGVAGTCTNYTNTATLTEIDGASASKTVTVCVGKDLTVSKDATPAFLRAYLWQIGKSVDHASFQAAAGSVTPNYTVTVTQTGVLDSGWGVTGTITVANPNDWEDITVTVGDAVDNGGVCSITGGTSLLVPKGGTATKGYTCTWSSAPTATSGTNTATVTWDATAAHTPTGSASGTAGFAFTTPTSTLNKTIHVTDSFNGGTGTALGTVTGSDAGAPYAPTTFLYPRTIPVPATGCVTYPNTARITETGQTASASVVVCGPSKTGALTMGFWQNKNGQGIIKAGSSTLGVCNLATWLRGYAPFANLSATASCAATATYVYNTIKAATAGGSTMNPMLKAQMLATALDVYFSDPALGGNKIGKFSGLGNAQQPIGGFTIDLTKICAMFDGSSGGTCNGTLENVSSVFGGATSMTVSQMLAYAASQSNPGGTIWYGQIKAQQGLAKDAFDAINNEKVFVI
jgi:large repetitive protein